MNCRRGTFPACCGRWRASSTSHSRIATRSWWRSTRSTRASISLTRCTWRAVRVLPDSRHSTEDWQGGQSVLRWRHPLICSSEASGAAQCQQIDQFSNSFSNESRSRRVGEAYAGNRLYLQRHRIAFVNCLEQLARGHAITNGVELGHPAFEIAIQRIFRLRSCSQHHRLRRYRILWPIAANNRYRGIAHPRYFCRALDFNVRDLQGLFETRSEER